MTMVTLVSVLFLVFTLRVASSLDRQFSDSPVAAVAYIELKGVIGQVSFQTINETAVKVKTNFTGLPENGGMGLNWHIHRFPVDLTLDPNRRCLNNYVGGHYDPLMVRGNPNYTTDCSPNNQFDCEIGDLTGKFGQLTNGAFENIDNTNLLKLGGLRGVVGRSIVIHGPDGANFVCGTIRSTIESQAGTEVITLSATFISPLAGVIYLRQAGSEHAVIFGKLFWVNRMETTRQHNWHIHENTPNSEYRLGVCRPAVGGHYDPFNRPLPSDPTYFCSPEPANITNCEVGDLTGKHDTVDVAANPFPHQEEAFFFTDIFLNLTGTNAVIDRSIAIHAANRGGPIVACAPLVRTETRVVQSFPDGEFVARQDSPYENTVINVQNLTFQNVDILSDVFSTYELCPLTRSPYDPLSVGTRSSFNTPDEIASGALYQKYSSQLRTVQSFSVNELPLFGTNVISSRTLRSSSNSRRTCTAIPQQIDQDTTVVAIATFNDTIKGTILFIQEKLSNGTLGQTNVVVDIHYASSSMRPTTGHNWHIHTRPPVPGQPCQGNIGPHFNPFNVSLDSTNPVSNYSTDCSPTSKLRCESGDLGGKHGQLRIDPPGTDMATFSYLDPNLLLYGPERDTIIGRSVGIHENIPGGPVLYCAEVRLANLSTVQLTISEPTAYNRVQFVNSVAMQSGVSAQSILVKQVDIRSSSVDGTTQCVNMTLSVAEFADSASMAASTVQSTVCDQYRQDRCMSSREDFQSLCPSGASPAATTLSLFMVISMLLIAVHGFGL